MKYFWNVNKQEQRIIDHILSKYKICKYNRNNGREFLFKLKYGRKNIYDYRTGKEIIPSTISARMSIDVIINMREVREITIAEIDRHGNMYHSLYSSVYFACKCKKDENGYTYFDI